MKHTIAWTIGIALQYFVPQAYADAPPGRYTIASDTVRDNRTMLTWQRAVTADSYSQGAASSYCSSLTLAGHSDWRLPTRAELSSLQDMTRVNPVIDLHAFPGTPLAWFWSSTRFVGRSAAGWTIDFVGGATRGTAVSDSCRVRCVR